MSGAGVMATHGLAMRGLMAGVCLGLAACAAQRLDARMALPASLAEQPLLPVGPTGAPRQGQFEWDGEQLSFERSAAPGGWHLSLFGANGGKAPLLLRWQGASDSRELRCTAVHKRVEVLGLKAEKPWKMDCQWLGDAQPSLQMREGNGRGLRDFREGEYRREGLVLQLRSVHHRNHSPSPQGVLGYVIESDGRALAAVDLSGSRPGLVLVQAGDARERRAASDLALALALAWEPLAR